MIRCLIVDDEPIAIRVLKHLLADISDVEIVATSTRPLDAIALVREHAVDLVFLDIAMPGLSGLDFARSLRHPPAIIFTTAHREHAVEGFDLDVADYLLKPIALPRLLRALEKVRSRLERRDGPDRVAGGVIHVRADRRVVAVRTRDIRHAEALGDYVVLHTAGGRITARMTLTELESELAPHGFLRVHRSFVVNPQHVASWSPGELVVGTARVPVGRTYRSAISDRMERLG